MWFNNFFKLVSSTRSPYLTTLSLVQLQNAYGEAAFNRFFCDTSPECLDSLSLDKVSVFELKLPGLGDRTILVMHIPSVAGDFVVPDTLVFMNGAWYSVDQFCSNFDAMSIGTRESEIKKAWNTRRFQIALKRSSICFSYPVEMSQNKALKYEVSIAQGGDDTPSVRRDILRLMTTLSIDSQRGAHEDRVDVWEQDSVTTRFERDMQWAKGSLDLESTSSVLIDQEELGFIDVVSDTIEDYFVQVGLAKNFNNSFKTCLECVEKRKPQESLLNALSEVVETKGPILLVAKPVDEGPNITYQLVSESGHMSLFF